MRTGEKEISDQDYTSWVEEEMKNTYTKQLKEYEKVVISTKAGIFHTEILRTARKEDIDLIVMGAHTRQEDIGAARYRNVVGSTMQKVAKSAHCPVLIVSRPCVTCFWYFSNIVFCTDFSKASYSAFLFAYKVAKEIGCKLYIFHSLDMSSMHRGRVQTQEEIEEEIINARKKIKSLYVSQMKDFENYEIEIWEGIPYVEILKYSREKEVDLIVMAHHTREVNTEKAILGSTVEQVILRAACPVASINRPDKVAIM